MDFEDLKSEKALRVISELNSLVKDMKRRNLKISAWFGSFDLSDAPNSINILNRGYGYKSLEGAADDVNFPWFKYWEIVWVTLNNEFKAGQKVLDMGGCSSLFSFYLAWKGLDVTAIDIRNYLVDNGNRVAEATGWKLKNFLMDMRLIENLAGRLYDHVTSLCVYEHLAAHDRVSVNQKVKDLLVKGGKFTITFDYQNPDRTANIASPQDIYEQFVAPSSLKLRGNQEFYDHGKRYLLHPFYYKKRLKLWFWKMKVSYILQDLFPIWEIFRTKNTNDFTFGALFFEKP